VQFKAKIDYVSLVGWFLYGFFLWVLIAVDLYALWSHHHLHILPSPFHTEFWFPILWAFSLAMRCFLEFREYYETRPSGLFLQQEWKRVLIPYATIDKLLPVSRTHNWLHGRLSRNCILVMPKSGKAFTISVAEKEKFLAELAEKCPQLEEKETDFGLSLQRAIA
jgi:hypothetical protein